VEESEGGGGVKEKGLTKEGVCKRLKDGKARLEGGPKSESGKSLKECKVGLQFRTHTAMSVKKEAFVRKTRGFGKSYGSTGQTD